MDDLRRDADRLADGLSAMRRDLHRHPELGFHERRTAGIVASRLEESGLEVRTGVAKTGVAALLRATDARGPAVLLRADMDALPIQEVDGRAYGSTVPGCMHACGHDGHTAMLLGAAELLAARRDLLRRDVLFCFQPAEEGPGGAAKMIEDGVLDWVEVGSVFGLHLWSPFEAGAAHVRPGPMLAGTDEFEATIVGRGGHGALPHRTRDPIVAAALAVTALQSVVARGVDPNESAVVTVGSFHAGTAPNVIPDRATLHGTTRAFRDDVRATLRRRVREVFERSAGAAGCALEFTLHEGYPPVVNDAGATREAVAAARRVFGEDGVHEPAPMAIAEDFAYFLRERPGAFVLVGAGNGKQGITAPHHSPEFDIDESVLPRGAELLARLALGE